MEVTWRRENTGIWGCMLYIIRKWSDGGMWDTPPVVISSTELSFVDQGVKRNLTILRNIHHNILTDGLVCWVRERCYRGWSASYTSRRSTAGQNNYKTSTARRPNADPNKHKKTTNIRPKAGPNNYKKTTARRPNADPNSHKIAITTRSNAGPNNYKKLQYS